MKVKNVKLNKKGIIRLVTAFLVCVIAVYSAFALIGNYSDISRLKDTAAKVSAKYDNQVAENDKVKAILKTENKDEYIEQKAREKGYAKEGEIVFYNISGSK